MITVSVKQLTSAIVEADVFKLPDMNAGTAYLYNALYNRILRNTDVKLSELDFNAFESEDIDSFNSLYADVFEKDYYAANGIMATLRNVSPVYKAVGYV
jgi:hypothetical protein